MISRRRVVAMSAKGVAALMATVSALPACRKHGASVKGGMDAVLPDSAGGAGDAKSSPQGIDWETFIVALAELAEAQFSPDWNQRTYVEEVQALMELLDWDDAHFETLYDGYASSRGDFPELNTAYEGGHFEVATIEFDAGDSIPLHNHPEMTGVIQCVSGAVRVEAFDLLDEPATSGNLRLKRVVNTTLRAGQFSTLTSSRGNIHALVAEEFTEMLDVFTPPYDDERMRHYRWYRRKEEPSEGDDIFEAWTV
jgi:predicted metal-dependent enzyme (double-stranded beta helix superfamily)